ncbi:protein serine/threonine phosphatase 2C family protein [archaeon]|nr:MAG: protein serine/threonine phosphatase 2C family protein [archaeon]
MPIFVFFQHLLRQMLAKDYRLRCNLDTIVVDDWVTFEGSDPLFEKDEFLVQEFVDFQSVLLLDDPTSPQPPLHILVVHPSLVTRTMFHQQVNGFTPAVCVGASTAEESISIMQSAMHSHPQNNFDYIFIELLLPTKTFALNTVTYIRKLGYQGKIIGMTVSTEDMDDFLKDGKVDSVVRRPIALRELTLLLTKTKLEENADNMLHNHGAPPVAKITAEEFDNAITFNASISSHSRSTSALSVSFNDDVSTIPSTKSSIDPEDDLDDENVKDFDTYTSAGEERHMESPADADMSRLSIVDKGGLMRKRAFMVVPYGASSDDRGQKESNEPVVSLDRPLKILNIKEDDGSRRLRREQAMKRSTLAHQYRVAKKEGDQDRITSSRSLLTLMKCQSKKSMKLERKSTRSMDDTDLPSPMLKLKSKAVQGLHSVSMRHIDQFINNTVSVAEGEDKVDSDSNLEDSDEEEESVLDSSSDDDDFGLDSDDIKQLDNDTFEEEFSKLIRKKSANDGQEMAEWNHIMVGVDFKKKLKCDPNMCNPELQLVVGMDENMVSRAYMEDRSYSEVKVEEREHEHRPSAAMFAVFDGHNGDYVAQALKERYGSQFMQLLKEYEDRVKAGQEDKGHYEAKIGSVFEKANALLDRDILEKDYARQQKSLHSGIQDMQTYAGSVGVVAVVMPAHNVSPALQRQSSRVEALNPRDGQSNGKRLQVFISHVGDCRAVLSHDGVAVQLTEDHKANLKHEKARIESAGGWVHNGRVNGALGVSRSFGDIQFKNFEHCQGHIGDEHESKGIWGHHQQVVSKPDYTHFIIEDSYEFMILACDGLWDVFSCQEAVNFVRKRLSVTMDVQQTAKDLIIKAIERGTQDNTSVIVVAFHQ